MDDLIGLGVAVARRRMRLTQEEAAARFRYHGLTAWRGGTVAQLEVGLRRPRLDECVLICAALDIALDDLLPGTDEPVELGNGATLTPLAIREYLRKGGATGGINGTSFPGDVRAECMPGDAERHAARRLGVRPVQVKLAARALWHRDFTDERDARVGDPGQLEPRSPQARRGLVSRALLGELRGVLGETPDPA